MRHFISHIGGFPKRGMRMNRLADIDSVRTHLNRKCHSTDHVARMGPDHAAAQYLAVTVRFG